MNGEGDRDKNEEWMEWGGVVRDPWVIPVSNMD